MASPPSIFHFPVFLAKLNKIVITKANEVCLKFPFCSAWEGFNSFQFTRSFQWGQFDFYLFMGNVWLLSGINLKVLFLLHIFISSFFFFSNPSSILRLVSFILLHIDLIGEDASSSYSVSKNHNNNADLLGTTLFIGLGLFAGLITTATLSLKLWRWRRRPPGSSKVAFLCYIHVNFYWGHF